MENNSSGRLTPEQAAEAVFVAVEGHSPSTPAEKEFVASVAENAGEKFEEDLSVHRALPKSS